MMLCFFPPMSVGVSRPTSHRKYRTGVRFLGVPACLSLDQRDGPREAQRRNRLQYGAAHRELNSEQFRRLNRCCRKSVRDRLGTREVIWPLSVFYYSTPTRKHPSHT
jgi:hypothetical protein